MQVASDPRPVGADPRERLRAAIAAFPGQPFAVVDGGHFDDLPALLGRERLFGRSMFLDQADVEVQKAGPWLVALDQEPEATDKVFALVGDRPAAVFWCCEAGEAVLHRHLRTIAMARIPLWAADGKEAPGPSDDPEACKTVFFRHFDPRVLGALLPCLDAAQFARILGPAEEIAFRAPDHGGFRRVVADPAWPKASGGLLMVRGDQCVALIGRRLTASHRRIAAYLRRHAPENVAHLDEAGLQDEVRGYEAQAAEFGARNERAVALWSYLQVTSRADLSRHPKVGQFLRSPGNGSTPEARVEALFDLRAAALKRKFG